MYVCGQTMLRLVGLKVEAALLCATSLLLLLHCVKLLFYLLLVTCRRCHMLPAMHVLCIAFE